MLIYEQIKQVREAVKEWKKEGKSVGFDDAFHNEKC